VGGTGHYHLGELLRPSVLADLLGAGEFRCAGLVERDLSSLGAVRVRNFSHCAEELRAKSLHILHHGGKILDGGILERYAASVEGEEAERFASLCEIAEASVLRAHVERRSGCRAPWPGLLDAEEEFFGAQVGFLGVGFSQLSALSDAERRRLLRSLGEARFLGVREAAGADLLEAEGLSVRRMPDPLTVLPDFSGAALGEARRSESLSAMRQRFPNGWIAVEVGVIPDPARERLRDALQQVAEDASLGLVFFNASHDGREGDDGCAWWVDSLGDFSAARFPSKQVWEVAAMLLASRLYCGGDLECRILAMGAGVPRWSVPFGDSELRGYAALWEDPAVEVVPGLGSDWAEALASALTVPLSLLESHAVRLRGACYEGIAAYREASGFDLEVASAEEVEPAEPMDHKGRRPLCGAAATHRARATRVRHLHDEWLEQAAAVLPALGRFRGARGKARHPGGAGVSRN